MLAILPTKKKARLQLDLYCVLSVTARSSRPCRRSPKPQRIGIAEAWPRGRVPQTLRAKFAGRPRTLAQTPAERVGWRISINCRTGNLRNAERKRSEPANGQTKPGAGLVALSVDGLLCSSCTSGTLERMCEGHRTGLTKRNMRCR